MACEQFCKCMYIIKRLQTEGKVLAQKGEIQRVHFLNFTFHSRDDIFNVIKMWNINSSKKKFGLIRLFLENLVNSVNQV